VGAEGPVRLDPLARSTTCPSRGGCHPTSGGGSRRTPCPWPRRMA